MRTGICLTIMALLTLVGSGACVNVGSGNSPETRYFLLEAKSTSAPDSTQRRKTANIAVGIGPVRVPRYLDRPQILTRLNDQELLADEFSHWAEPLKTNIPRVMGENLSALAGGSRIWVFPWKPSTHLDFHMSVNIFRFEADADGKVILKATWRIDSVKDRQVICERRVVIKQISKGAAVGDRVAGMSLALSDLALGIAGDLADLNPVQ